MRKRPVQLRGKEKIRIDRRCLPRPQTAQFRPNVPVKRSVNFYDVKESRQKFYGMNFLACNFWRIENPVPVFVRPAGSPDADSRNSVHTGRPDARRLAQRLARLACV